MPDRPPSALTLARQLGYVPFAEALTQPWSRVVTRKEIVESLRTEKAETKDPLIERAEERRKAIESREGMLPGMRREDWEG